MIPERQVLMAGLPVAAVTAVLYLVLVTAHLMFESSVAYALVLATLMSGGAWIMALMLSPLRADTDIVESGLLSCGSANVLAEVETESLSADEEERLISQLEHELEILEERYRRELTAMQDATRKSAGSPHDWGRSK